MEKYAQNKDIKAFRHLFFNINITIIIVLL